MQVVLFKASNDHFVKLMSINSLDDIFSLIKKEKCSIVINRFNSLFYATPEFVAEEFNVSLEKANAITICKHSITIYDDYLE